MTELQVGVKVLLMNTEERYLLIRRSAEKYKEVTNKWDIPGGRMDAGSTLLDNLKREVSEETGLEMISEPTLVYAQDIFPKDTEKHVVRLTYIGEADGVPRLSEEHTEYKWATLEEMKSLPNLDRYLKFLLDRGLIS